MRNKEFSGVKAYLCQQSLSGLVSVAVEALQEAKLYNSNLSFSEAIDLSKAIALLENLEELIENNPSLDSNFKLPTEEEIIEHREHTRKLIERSEQLEEAYKRNQDLNSYLQEVDDEF